MLYFYNIKKTKKIGMKTKSYRTSKKKDSSRKAKPLGYRYKGLDKSHPNYYKRPSAEEIELFEAGDKRMRRKLAYENRPERSDSNQKNKLKRGGSLDIEFMNSNLYLVGKGHDQNGNYVVKVKFPNSTAFSIQTNGVLPKTHYNLKSVNKISELSDEQKSQIEKEVVEYISEYGSSTQKNKLKVYSGFDSTEVELDDEDSDDDNSTDHDNDDSLKNSHELGGRVDSKTPPVIPPVVPVVVNKDEELKKYYGVEIPTHDMEVLAERPIKWHESIVNVNGYLFKKVFMQPFWLIQ